MSLSSSPAAPAVIGIDIGKEVFHLVGFDAGGKIVLRRKIKRLALADAFGELASCVVGMEGQSAGSLNASVPPAPLAAEVRPDSQGFLKLTEAGVDNDFAQDLSPAEKLELYAAQAPTNVNSLGGAIGTPAWRSRPSWYIVAA